MLTDILTHDTDVEDRCEACGHHRGSHSTRSGEPRGCRWCDCLCFVGVVGSGRNNKTILDRILKGLG